MPNSLDILKQSLNQQVNDLNSVDAEIRKNPYLSADIANIQENTRRALNPYYAERATTEDDTAYDLRNFYNEQDPQLEQRVQEKINNIVEQRIHSPEKIFEILNSDEDLAKRFPTNADKMEAIAAIQSQIKEASSSINALSGKTITDDGNIASEMAGATWGGLKRTVSSPVYAIRRWNALNKLDNLPLHELDSIKNKLDTAQQIQARIQEAKEELLSPNLGVRAKALKDLEYYSGTLKGLGLTSSEQALWDTYGDEYSSLKADLAQIDTDKAKFTGSNNISADEARVLMNQYQREEAYKSLNIDPGLGTRIVDAISDATSSWSSVGRSLGNVLSSAIPFMLPIPGLGVAAFTSTAMEYSAELMQHHLEKYGELPSDEQLKACIYGALAAGIDYFGTKGLVKGYGAGKVFAGIGKTEAMRTADQIAKTVNKTLEPLRRGMSDRAFSQLYLNTLKNELAKVGLNTAEQAGKEIATSLDKAMNKALYKETLGSTIARKVREIPEGITRTIAESPIKAVRGIGIVGKGVAKANNVLHTKLDSGILDLAKAGAGLSAENVGSSLVRQHYKGEYDNKEIAQGLVDGFISGGLFHAASNAVAIPASKASPWLKEKWNNWKNAGINLDSRSDFSAQMNVLRNTKDPKVMKYLPKMGSFLKESYTKVKDTVDDIENGLEAYRNNETLKNSGFAIDKDGNAYVDLSKYKTSDARASDSLATVKEAVKKYNKGKEVVNKFKNEIEDRLGIIDDALKTATKNRYEESIKNKEYFTDEEREEIEDEYLDSLSEKEIISHLEETEKMSEATAKAYYNATKSEKSKGAFEEEKDEATGVTLKEILKRGNTNYFKYADVLSDSKARDALFKFDYAAFKSAVTSNSHIKPDRVKKVLEYFTEDKFEQYERTKTDEIASSVVTKLNKAAQKDLRELLKVPNEKVELDDTNISEDNLRNYFNQQLFTESKTIDQIQQAILEKHPKLDENLKKKLNEIAGEAKAKLKEVNRINDEVLDKKVYKNQKEAEEALERVSKNNKGILSAFLKVHKVAENKFVLTKTNLKEATDALKDLLEKEEVEEKDINKFYNTYREDLDVLTSDVKGKIQTILDKYTATTNEAEKKRLKKLLINSFDTIIEAQTNRYNMGLNKYVSSEEVRTAVHGYTTKRSSELAESFNRKRAKEAKAQKAKEDKEQESLSKEASSLSREQAYNLIVNAIDSLFTDSHTNLLDSTTDWSSAEVFTLRDLRNLRALISSGKLDEQGLYYANTLLACMEKTKIHESTTYAHLIDFNSAFTTPRADFSEAQARVIGDKGYVQQLREAYENKFNEPVPSNYMYLPESHMDENMDESLLSAETQRRIKARKALEFGILNSSNFVKDILKQLIDYKVYSKDNKGKFSESNALKEACYQLGIQYPNNLDAADNAYLADLLLSLIPSSYFQKAIGLDIGSTVDITHDNFTRLIGSKDFTSIEEAKTVEPTKLVKLKTSTYTKTAFKKKTELTTKKAGETEEEKKARLAKENTEAEKKHDELEKQREERVKEKNKLVNAYNNSKTLKQRLIALDNLFNAQGGFIDMYIDSLKDSPFLADMYRDLIITRLASDTENLTATQAFLSAQKIDVDKINTEEELLRTVEKYYAEEPSTTTDDITPYAVKQALLYAFASKLSTRAEDLDKDKTNVRDDEYSKLLNLYNLVETLPNYNVRTNKKEAYVIDKVTKDDLIPLAVRYITSEVELDKILQDTDKSSDTDLHLTVSEHSDVIQNLYVNGVLDYTGNHASKISEQTKVKLAKILALKFNSEGNFAIKGTTTGYTGSNILSAKGSSNKLETYLAYSKYRKDLEINPTSILATLDEEITPSFISRRFKDYAGKENLKEVIKLINNLNRLGTRFLSSNMIIDEIFGSSFNGRVGYTQEFLSILSATGLSNLQGLTMRQSPDWLAQKVTSGQISSNAANLLANAQFADYVTTVMSLGRQAMHALGLRIKDENSIASIENQVCAEIGSRILHLLESANYVKKGYLTYDGNIVDKQPTSGTFMRVLTLAPEGETVLDTLEANDKYEYTDSDTKVQKLGHVLDDLLGYSKEIEPKNYKELIGYQKGLEKRFEADFKVHDTTKETVDILYVNSKGEDAYDTFRVTTCEFTGLTKVERIDKSSGKPLTFRSILDSEGKSTDLTAFYLDKKATFKTSGSKNSANDLVELAFKSSEGQEVHRNEYNGFFKDYIKNAKVYTELPIHIQKALGMDTDPTSGIFETYRQGKNAQIFRTAKEFDARIRTTKEGDVLFFPVITTPNNRFLVNSPRYNYREFKPVREFFSPVDHIALSIKGERSKTANTMLKGTVLFNLGVDVDKMTFDDIDKAFTDTLTAFEEGIKALPKTIDAEDVLKGFMVEDGKPITGDTTKDTAIREFVDRINQVEFTVYKGKAKPKGIEIEKIGSQLLLKELLSKGGLDILNNIKNNKAISHFPYRIEIDGLNNGSGHHFSQSGVFSDNDEISIAKSIAVGVIPPEYSGEFKDFLSAMADGKNGFKDVYMLSASVGETRTKEDIAQELITGLNAEKDKESYANKVKALKILAEIYDVKVTNSENKKERATRIEDIIPELLSRDVMKKVAMPSTYGAGMQALLMHLATNIDKEIAKYTYKNKDNVKNIIKLYTALKDLNGGHLKLMDSTGKLVDFYKVRDSVVDLHNFLPIISANASLFDLFKETCLVNAVKGAKSVTEEATERAQVLTQANEALCAIFKASVKQALDTYYKDRDISTLTWKEQKRILSIVSSELTFGTQEQTLNLLKPALIGTLSELSYNKVTGYYDGGSSSVRYTTALDKESLGSGLPPVFIHGFDAGNIAYAQQMVRNTLKAFTGVHDAIMINYNQLIGADSKISAPQAMNRAFIEGSFTAHKPLLYMAQLLTAGLQHLPNLNIESTISINNAINSLRTYAGIEINNTQKILAELRNKPDSYIFNQFGWSGDTAFRASKVKDWVSKQTDKLQKSLDANNLITSDLISYKGFLDWMERNHNELYKQLKKSEGENSILFSIAQFKSVLNSKDDVMGFNAEQKTAIGDLLEEYVKYYRGLYDQSFYKNFLDSLDEVNSGAIIISNFGNDPTNPKSTKDILSNLINIINNSNKFKNIRHEAYITKFLGANLGKLQGLLSTSSNDYHTLAALVKLTTSNGSIRNSDLNDLIDLLNKSAYTTTSFNIQGLNTTQNSIFMDVSDINLPDFLAYMNNEAAKLEYLDDVSEETKKAIPITNYLNKYLEKLEERLKDTGAEQIILKMDSAIDLMLFTAINKRIAEAPSTNIFYGKKIAIAPNITDKAGLNVNKNVTYYNNLDNAFVTKNNLYNFNVINATQNKDLEVLNFKYHSQFTDEGLVGQYVENTFTVGTDKNGRPETRKQLGRTQEPIYVANYYGEIETVNTNGTATPNMMYVQRNATDIAGIARYENSVVQYNAERVAEEASKKDLQYLDAKDVSLDTTDFSDIKNNAHLVFSLDSDGNFVESEHYNIIKEITPIANAYKQAKDAYKRMRTRLASDPSISRAAIHQPITLDVNLNNLTKIKVSFMITEDPVVSAYDLFRNVSGQSSNASNYRYGNYVFNPLSDTNSKIDKAFRNIFKNDLVNNNHLSDPRQSFSKWVRKQFDTYHGLEENVLKATYITVPKEFRNPEYDFEDNISLRNINNNFKYDLGNEENVIFFGYSAIPERHKPEGNTPKVYIFDEYRNVQQQKAIATKFNTNLRTRLNTKFSEVKAEIRMRHYTSPKSEDEMNSYDKAVYKDLTCKDSTSLFNTLVQEDNSRGLDTSHLSSIFRQLRSLNMNVRYYLNNLAYSQGGAFIETINAKPTGYINFNTKGTGSHAEVFLHEWSHIPLEYLKYDANAYRLATQLYQFSAKNLTLEDFDCSTEEAKRIYNYIFRDSSTVDPQIEFITYSLTNSDFRKALDNMAKRSKFRKEFNAKKESVLARFVNKISGSLNKNASNNINNMVFDIFKRSVDLCNEYQQKVPVDEEAYATERLQLSNADMKIYDALKGITKAVGLDTVSNTLGTLQGMEEDYETLRNISNNEKTRNTNPDVLPAILDTFGSVKGAYSDVYNQLRQSFEGVSDGNYSYVKLRYQAKETIDKARENSASALNEVVRNLTKDISQKTLNEMTNYVLKADMSCLLDDGVYDKDTLKKILTDSKFRNQEINRLKKTLSKSNMGNYFINASKGLVDKLTIGVNTSGIGYNNAYEIANISGSSIATLESPYTKDIDKLITLQVMNYYDKQNPSVYRELSKNLDSLVEVLNIHSGLKKLEYSDVYATSMQKVHIPKGELHGGKVHNRYAVVPKSQLKAYEYAGYKSLGKAKLDTFYSTITNEDFYKVQAKYMPDVPYVDGIPVLTDVFNGRNKTGTYLGGKRLESTQIDPQFHNVEFNALSRYIQSKVNMLNSPNYFAVNPKDLDGVITPTYGIGNSLKGCDFQLNEVEQNKYLNRHVKFTSALGDHYGSIIERTRAPEWNMEASQALDDLYQQRRDKYDFTWLNESNENPDLVEAYKLLPFEMKKFFNDKYNGKGVPVETRYLTGIIGYREMSASKVDLEWNNKLRHSVTDYISHIFHNGYVAKGETLLRYLTKLGKENIVIKGIAVSVDNILSNNVTLGVLGLSPKQVCNYQIEGLNNLLKYKEMSRERYMLKTKEVTSSLTEQDRARLRGLEASMHDLPISYLAEHGAMPTIAEDITESDRLAKDLIDTHLPKELQTIAHNIVGDQKSWLYRHLSDLATFGDITARYALFKHLTEDKHINNEEAFRQCMQTFIDYSNPLPKGLQYFDSIGALPFTKFLLGNQTNVLNSLVKKPSRALMGIMASSVMGVPSIYDSILGLDSFTNRWKIPGFGLMYDSLGSLPINRAFDVL